MPYQLHIKIHSTGRQYKLICKTNEEKWKMETTGKGINEGKKKQGADRQAGRNVADICSSFVYFFRLLSKYSAL